MQHVNGGVCRCGCVPQLCCPAHCCTSVSLSETQQHHMAVERQVHAGVNSAESAILFPSAMGRGRQAGDLGLAGALVTLSPAS